MLAPGAAAFASGLAACAPVGAAVGAPVGAPVGVVPAFPVRVGGRGACVGLASGRCPPPAF